MKLNVQSKGPGVRGQMDLLHTIQAAVVIAGLVLSLVALIVALVGGAPWPTIAAVLSTLVAFGAIVFYSFRGYLQQDTRYYLVSIYCVAAMLFFRSLVPGHTMLTEGLITLGFGALLIFAERMDNPQQAQMWLAVVLCLLVTEALIVGFMPLGDNLTSLQSLFVRLMPWTHVVLVGSLALTFASRKHNL